MSQTNSSIYDMSGNSDLEENDLPIFHREPPDLRPINNWPPEPSVPPDHEIWYPSEIDEVPTAPPATAPPSYMTDPPPPGVSPEITAAPNPNLQVPLSAGEPVQRDHVPSRTRSPVRTPPRSPGRRRRHSQSRVRQAGSSHRSDSSRSTVDDPVNLVHALETIVQELNVETNFDEISVLCEDLLDIVFDSVHKMFTNLPIFPDNFRRVEVDRLLERHPVGGLLLQKFEVVSRVSNVHPDPESRASFIANFLKLTRGIQSVQTILTTLYGKLHETGTLSDFPEPNVEQFRQNMHDKLSFLQSLSHVVAGLVGRQVDIQQLEDYETEWRSQTLQIDTLRVPGKVRLAASRLSTHHARPGDHQLVERFTEQQFNLISNIEERLEQNVENVQSFHSEVINPGRNGLKLSSRALSTSNKLTKLIPGLFIIVQKPGFNLPQIHHNSALAQEVLKHHIDLNFMASPVTVKNLKLEMDRLVLFTQTLLELPGVKSNIKVPSSSSPQPQRKTGKSPSNSFSNVNITHTIDLLLAECREYAVQLEHQVNECQVFYDADPEDVNQYVRLSDDLNAIQKFALTSLESLKTASRAEELSDYTRTLCRSEIATLEQLFRRSNNLSTQFTRLDRNFKFSLDNKNKMFLKNHQQMKISSWPVSSTKGTKKLSTAEISQNFLTFMSEILQACSSPFLTNRQRLRKLTDSISSPIIRAATAAHVTFPSAVSYLLQEFKPEKSAILVTTRGLNRIGSKNGAPNPPEEYKNLLSLRKLKMDALKSHYLLKVLEKCIGNSSAQLQSVGNKLRAPDYIDTLILDFSSYQNLEEFLPGAPGQEPKLERRAQVEILLSYQIQRDSLERFVRKGLCPETQMQFYRGARSLNVDLSGELTFQGYFWHFCDTHMALSSNTASGLKHQLEISANHEIAGAAKLNYHHYGILPEECAESEAESSEVEETLALWTQTGAKPKRLKKPLKNEKPKKPKRKNNVKQNNLAASSTSPLHCPLEPANEHKKHRPYQCPLLRKPTPSLLQSFVNKRVCIACLNKPLSESHSNSCQPMTQDTQSRELVPLYCDRCSRLNIPKLKISCLQNKRICNCAQKKYRQNNSNSGSKINLTTSPKTSRPASRTKLNKKAFKSKDQASKSASHSLNTTLETEASGSSDGESEIEDEQIFYIAPNVESSGKSSPEPEEISQQIQFNTLWYQKQEQEAVESDPGEEPDNLEENLAAFHFGWFGIDGIEYEDETELEHINEPLGHDSPEPVIVNKFDATNILMKQRPGTPTVQNFSLAKLSEDLPYVNDPECQTFLLSESLDFISKSGLHVKRRAIWDSGAQKTCINLLHIPQDCFFGRKARFNIQTVNGDKECLDSIKATFFISNSPQENAHPVVYKFSGLGLRFNQKVCTPDLELDDHDKKLLQALQARISSYRAHHLMCIIGSDCLSVWPSEVLRTDNYCIYRSKINPKRLLAAGNFESNFKEKTKKQLDKIKVQLLVYDEHQTFPHLESRQLETNLELEDCQIQQLFKPTSDRDDHPFLTSILHCSEPSMPQPLKDDATTEFPRHSSPYHDLPDLEYSCSSDDDQSEVSSVYDDTPYSDSPYRSNSLWYSGAPSTADHSVLTLEEDHDLSLPSCSTDHSNCLTDLDKIKYAAALERKLNQRLQQLEYYTTSFATPDPTVSLDHILPDLSTQVVESHAEHDSDKNIEKNVKLFQNGTNQEKNI